MDTIVSIVVAFVGIALGATARTNELLISANSKAVYAKARICIVGSRKVIEALVVQNKGLAIVSTEAMTRANP